MTAFGVVVNPKASANRRHPARAERLRKILGSDGLVAQTDELGAIDDVARRFQDRGIEILAVCGGDGTLFRTVTAFRRVYGAQELPTLLPLRAGTMNVVATSIDGMHGSAERVLDHVVRDHREGRAHTIAERDLVAVNGEEFGFLFGLGMIVNFLRAYYAGGRPTPLGAAALLAKFSLSALLGTPLARDAFEPFAAEIVSDGVAVPFDRFTLCLAMTIDRLPLGFRPGYLATSRPGSFQLLAGAMSPAEVVRHLPSFRYGIRVEDERLYDGLVRDARITFARPTHYMVDAEILGPVDSLRLSAGPRLRLIRG